MSCPFDPCNPNAGLTGDASFRRFRDYLNIIGPKWAAKPVYLTETNTKGYAAKEQPNEARPATSYVSGWLQTAYQEVGNYHAESDPLRASLPRVLCLAWFVDSDRGNQTWTDYARSNTDPTKPKLQQARADFLASVTATRITT